jgi:ribosome-associated protein
MDIRKLQRAIVDGLEDVKAQDIAVFNTEHLSPLFERVIIASGTSNRQTKALAASVRDEVRTKGFQVMRTEGEDNGEWIIVDCGAAVVHIMQPTIRHYYHLEEIWGEKPVKLKIDSEVKRLPKASAPDDEPVKKSAGKKTAATKAPAKKVAAKKVAAKKAPAKKTAASSAPAKKAPAKKVASKPAAKTVVVKVPAPKAAIKKAAAAKKVAAKRPAAKPVAKPVAKKPAAKKAAKKA